MPDSELPQSLAAASPRKLVERTLFATGCDPRQRRIEIELREVDIGCRADRRQRRLDKAWRGNHAAVLGACLLTGLAEGQIGWTLVESAQTPRSRSMTTAS